MFKDQKGKINLLGWISIAVVGWALFMILIKTNNFKGTGRTPTPSQNVSSSSEWLPLCMNVWPGVKVYYGDDKTYWGTILDFDDNYLVPGTGQRIRAVKVLMSNGSI